MENPKEPGGKIERLIVIVVTCTSVLSALAARIAVQVPNSIECLGECLGVCLEC